MSQIPGFSLNSMGAPSNQPPQQSMPPNMIFSQQHQLLSQHQQQRPVQASPSQSQGISGVSDPEHQRFWQQLDQQVRPNPGDPTHANYAQMAQYFRNPSMHSQQGNLQGFQAQMQSHNVNPNQVHHPNANPQQVNNMVGQLNPSQLQTLEHNSAIRQLIQLRQQQAQQQQHQNTGNMTSQYPVDFGFVPSTSHTLNPNSSAGIAADLARQFDLMSRAGQNQGQNGNSINLGQVNPPTNRPGQVQGLSSQSAMAQQGLSFQQANHAINMQVNMMPHQSVVSHQNVNAAQQAQLNRQMYTGGTSVNPNNGNSGAISNNGPNNALAGRASAPGSIQPGAVNPNTMNSRRRVELQLTALQQDISKSHKLLSDIGWFSGMTTMTDQQRQLAAEYEQKKILYDRYRSALAQVNANGQAVSNPPASNPLVHGWPGQAGKPNGPPGVNIQQATSRIPGGGPQQVPMQGPPSSPFPQQQPTSQQPQTMFTPMQQQQTLPVPRAPSAQSMNSAMQQVQQQQQQRPQTGSVSGPLFEPQGQAIGGAGLRPPTAPPQSGTAAVTVQSSRTANRTPMQGQGQTPSSHGTQGISSSNVNVHLRSSPNGVDPNVEKDDFDAQLKVVLARHNITINSRDLFIDTKEVQLHKLFAQVMERGANAAVSQNNAWAVIGAILGFVQFPANGGEPARSSTHIAQHLQYLYQKYLFPYEQMYLTRLSQEKRRSLMQTQPPQNTMQLSQQQQQQLHHLQQQQLAAQQHLGQRQPNGGGFSFMQNPAMVMQAQQQQNAEAQRQLQQATHTLAPQQQQIQTSVQAAPHLNMRTNVYTQFANMSANDLRKLGIPENNIAIIEQNRPVLQRQYEQQQMLAMQQRGQVQIQQNQTSQQMNPGTPQMPGVRSNIQGSGGATQMHPVNVAQVPQFAHSQNPNAHHQIPAQVQNDSSQIYTRPTQALLTSAKEFIQQAVNEHTAKIKQGFPLHFLRDVDRPVYVHVFNQFLELATDMEKKLVMFHALFHEVSSTQKLIIIITTAKEQKRLMASGSNQYILALPMVQNLMNELRILADKFQKAIATIPPSPTQFPPAHPAQPIPTNHVPVPNQPPVMLPQPGNEIVSLSQTPQNAPPLQTHNDTARAQPTQQQFQQNLQIPAQTQPTSKLKRSGTGGVANTPSPAAPATPFMNAPTPPTTSSPRTPKSPPKKPSHAVAPATNSAPVPVSKTKPTTVSRRPSKAGQNPAIVLPALPPVEETKAGIKRSRDEEAGPSGIHSEPLAESIAKKLKREDWDGLPDEEFEKRQKPDNLETNQDVQNFLARTADDLLVGGTVQIGDNSAENPGEDIPNALQDFLRSAPLFGITESFHMPHTYGDPIKIGDFSPSGEQDSLFESFLDLSKCAQDDPIPSSSKLDPPELVHSSANPSTNPSPESAAETPKYENAVISGKIRENAIKIEIMDDFNIQNPLGRSLWSELNNGESAYYEQTHFKYDGDLPVQDSPWAISSGGT